MALLGAGQRGQVPREIGGRAGDRLGTSADAVSVARQQRGPLLFACRPPHPDRQRTPARRWRSARSRGPTTPHRHELRSPAPRIPAAPWPSNDTSSHDSARPDSSRLISTLIAADRRAVRFDREKTWMGPSRCQVPHPNLPRRQPAFQILSEPSSRTVAMSKKETVGGVCKISHGLVGNPVLRCKGPATLRAYRWSGLVFGIPNSVEGARPCALAGERHQQASAGARRESTAAAAVGAETVEA